MQWKDTLLPGASRIALPWQLNGEVLPGYAGDSNPDPQAGYQQRNDWVAGPGGRPVISGSSEAQGYGGGPSEGFFPVTPGVYGGQTFTGRTPAMNAAAKNYMATLARPQLTDAYRKSIETLLGTTRDPSRAALLRWILG